MGFFTTLYGLSPVPSPFGLAGGGLAPLFHARQEGRGYGTMESPLSSGDAFVSFSSVQISSQGDAGGDGFSVTSFASWGFFIDPQAFRAMVEARIGAGYFVIIEPEFLAGWPPAARAALLAYLEAHFDYSGRGLSWKIT